MREDTYDSPEQIELSSKQRTLPLRNNNMIANDEGEEQRNQKPRRRRLNVLFGVTGSVAAVKTAAYVMRLVDDLDANVRLVLTNGARHFWDQIKDYDPHSWDELQKKLRASEGMKHVENSSEINSKAYVVVHASIDEWKEWNHIGDPVLHINLREWSDVALVAPLTAHTLAKLANGFCDDLLTSCLRAWDFGHDKKRPGKPIVLAPAMNTAMWEHPLTRKQLNAVLQFWKDDDNFPNGIRIVEPQEKTLACGEIGVGALAPIETIIEAVQVLLSRQ